MIGDIFSAVLLAETHQDLVRNIVSLRVSEDLFDDLSAAPADWQVAIDLELATKPKSFVSATPVIDRPFEEAFWNEAIVYPFRNWMRSRYSAGSFGVWYGADTIETSVFETVHHWRTQLLQDAGFMQPGIKLERKLYEVGCDAALVDLRLVTKQFPALVDRDDYTLTHLVGAKLHREGHPGLVTKSARCPGDVYAILNPRVLSNPRPVAFLTYTTTAAGVTVEREPGVTLLEL